MTRISAFTGGFSGYRAMSRSFAVSGGEYTGAIMLFAQTAAPTGWTKLTSDDDCTLRVVSGTTSSGGTVNFSSVFTDITPSGTTDGVTLSTIGNTTLSSPQIPTHTHTAVHVGSGFNTFLEGGAPISRAIGARLSYTSGTAGTGGSHTHPSPGAAISTTFAGSSMNFNIKYVDVILAQRN